MLITCASPACTPHQTHVVRKATLRCAAAHHLIHVARAACMLQSYQLSSSEQGSRLRFQPRGGVSRSLQSLIRAMQVLIFRLAHAAHPTYKSTSTPSARASCCLLPFCLTTTLPSCARPPHGDRSAMHWRPQACLAR